MRKRNNRHGAARIRTQKPILKSPPQKIPFEYKFTEAAFFISGHKVILKEILLPEAYGDSACWARAVDSFWNPDPAVSKIPQLPGGSVSHSYRTDGPGSGRVSLRLF